MEAGKGNKMNCTKCGETSAIMYATNGGLSCETCLLIRETFSQQGVWADPLATPARNTN